MALVKPKTKHKFEESKSGEEVLDLVISYIHDVNDRNSVSLVSRKFYELDGITRKRITVHTPYYPNHASFSKRFPFIESLTLKGSPSGSNDYGIQITPWIEQLALEFRCLKELCICGLVVHDEDLATLARTRGKDLRSLNISKCKGFSTDGLRHVSQYCNRLKTLCLEYCYHINVKDGVWLHQLALNSTVLERLHVSDIDITNNAEELTLLAKNCCNSLISLKIGRCHLSKLGDAFRYAFRLEEFCGGYVFYKESGLVGFQFPPNLRSLSRMQMRGNQYSSVLPLLNQIRKLKFIDLDDDNECLFFTRCPNLEVLYTHSGGDRGLQVLGQFCKKLRKLTIYEAVTHAGLIALAKGCTKIECLKVRLIDIPNEAIEFVGNHLKNLRKFRMDLVEKDGTTNLPLDKGIQAMLMGCGKLESLDISLWNGGLTDVGLEYIGKYGSNLKSLSLSHVGNSDVGHMSYEAIKCPGTHLKNLRKFRMHMHKKYRTTNVELDNGILAMLMGCKKLERLDIGFSHGGLTDVGLEYIGKYGHNLKFLSLTRIGNSDAGLVNLSKGCRKLRKLKLIACPFSEQVVTNSVFNMPSLRYVWFVSDDPDHLDLELTRPEFKL